VNKKIELLSPAKNIECAIEAINHGADAVYIGAPKFSARAAAGNSVQDIEQLALYAHKFNARVYVTINTILKDSELEEVQALIWDLYHAGADAIIIQDMGILQLDLPPIALHASTQMDNRTVEKVQFLEQTGFSQIVLARELNLEQIKNITSQTNVPIEVFVHGALCVSYSGQCYISQALCGRSANRGECAQYCRLPYELVDAEENVIARNKHLLSLKDLNLSDSLSELLDAGVSSFKIEGRLKDVGYVKNVTAFYRQKLDQILSQSDNYKKSSSGKTTYFFEPNLEKSFHRGSTSYFLKGRNTNIVSFETPKSVGEYVGKAKEIGRNYLVLANPIEFHNGDGLCFLNPQGDFSGFRVNRVEGNRLYPHEMPKINQSTDLYRNLDQAFTQLLAKKTAERKMAVDMSLSDTENGFLLEIKDEDNNLFVLDCPNPKELAKNKEKVNESIQTQLSKLGNTDFYANAINLNLSQAFFIQNSLLADWRRKAIEELTKIRVDKYHSDRKEIKPTTHAYPEKELSYLGNVYNEKAKQFYVQHGVEEIAPAFEKLSVENTPLMFTKHCLKYNFGYCPKSSSKKENLFIEPFSLRYKDKLLRLEFDCKNCQMIVIG
jgi:putative protease